VTGAIEVEKLTKRYGAVCALDAVDLVVERGTITGLLGANGAGKTTLVEIFMGMRAASEGSVRVLGEDPWNATDLSWRRQLGYLPQEVAPLEYLSATEYIALVTELYGCNALDLDARLQRAFALFDLVESGNKRLGTFSTGMRKKTVLCSLYVARPALLVLDEPFEGLDPHAIRQLQEWLTQFAREGGTVLLSSHAIPLVQSIADRVAIMDAGRILFAGPVHTPAASGAGTPSHQDLESLYFSLVRRAEYDGGNR
jgi:ABC-2 type transport system ATP-binding protein